MEVVTAGPAGGPVCLSLEWNDEWLLPPLHLTLSSLSSGLLKKGNRGVECVEVDLESGRDCEEGCQFAPARSLCDAARLQVSATRSGGSTLAADWTACRIIRRQAANR